MKKFSLFVIAVVLFCSCAAAQCNDALKQVADDWRKMSGMEGPHRFDGVNISKAPEGFTPFYIGHYGRHGSRYAWDDNTYILLHEVFSKAHEEKALTALGEEFYGKYEDFYELPLINTGDLVRLGFEQHQKLGKIVYEQFPEVFTEGRKVYALSSTSGRCIVSMGSFCMSLSKSCPAGLDFDLASNHAGMAIIAPPSAPAKLRRHFYGEEKSQAPAVMPVNEFNEKTIDYKGILSRLFKDPAYVEQFEGGHQTVCFELFALLNGYRNYSEEPIFDGLLTNEQLVGLWEATNYYSFTCDVTARYSMIPLLEDFISKADAAIADRSIAANLRFGHDYVAEAFTCLINANNAGTIPHNPTDVKKWFQSYNIPMATTLLFVLYTNDKNEILFKFVWNEQDAFLPQLTPVEGCYYRWSDFCEWAGKIISEHPDAN